MKTTKKKAGVDDALFKLLYALDEKFNTLMAENRDLKQMVGQIGHNLDVMRGERTTSTGSKPYTGTERPADLPTNAPKRLCPRCLGTMRWVRNSSDGSIFAGCRSFPECRGTRRQHDAENEAGLVRDLQMKEERKMVEQGAEFDDPNAPDPEDAPF